MSLSTFIECGKKVSGLYYTERDYNMTVMSNSEETYQKIAKLTGIKNYAYFYETAAGINIDKYATEFGKKEIPTDSGNYISIIAYNNEYFKQYIQELGLKNIDYKKDAILIDEFVEFNSDNTKTIQKLYDIKENSNISISLQEKEKNITVVKNTDKRPMGIEQTYYTSGMLIVSTDFIDNIKEVGHLGYLELDAENADELENTINDLTKSNAEFNDVKVTNYDTYVKQENRMVLVIAIFLYGFMTVISLIGVTNIFNTITTNMILRSKEFAMLKSIGMTSKEFNRMIRLESILYGVKSLLIGLPIGILGSYLIYKAFTQSVDIGYSLPWFSIIISIVFVFLIVSLTMKYSLNKINKQNIIDTIRQDNI